MTLEAFNGDERYRIEAALGTGAMATVYKAYDLRLQRTVALKVLHEHLSSNTELRVRFEQEAKLAARIDHPNVVRIYDFGVDPQGHLAIVSEFVDGRSLTLALRQFANRFQPYLHPALAALVALEIARGIEAAHRHSVIHRDLKPDNVLVHHNGEVKLTDFGVARPFDSSLTQAGQFIGSLIYASPEQVQGKKVDHRSDLFSFGVILFELLTGQLPFRSSNPTDLALKISQAVVPPLNQIRASIPIELDSIVRKCLRISPAERPQSADIIVQELNRFLSSQEIIPSHHAITQGFENPTLFASTIRRSSLIESTQASAPTPIPQVPPPDKSNNQIESNSSNTLKVDINKPILNEQNRRNPSLRGTEEVIPVARKAPLRKPKERRSVLSNPILGIFTLGILAFFLIKERESVREMIDILRQNQKKISTPNKTEPSSSGISENAPREALPLSRNSGEDGTKSKHSKPDVVQLPVPSPTAKIGRLPTAFPSPKPSIKSSTKNVSNKSNDIRNKSKPNKQSPIGPINSASSGQKMAQNTVMPQHSIKTPAPTPQSRTTSQLILRTEPGEMTIFINGRFEGMSPRTGVPRTFTVPAGTVYLRIPAQASNGIKYQEFSQRVRVDIGKVIELPKIELIPVENESDQKEQ